MQSYTGIWYLTLENLVLHCNSTINPRLTLNKLFDLSEFHISHMHDELRPASVTQEPCENQVNESDRALVQHPLQC